MKLESDETGPRPSSFQAVSMQSVSFPARQARSHYRHELRTLTYVTLDEANGGIIRNLNHEGVAVQAVGALRVQQRIRLRFELRFPRLRVEAYGEVSWASPTGQCGIRFVDLPPRISHQINNWMFSNLLDAIARETTHPGSIFEAPVIPIVRHGHPSEESDGLTLSPTPRPAIRLEPDFNRRDEARVLLLQGKKVSAQAYEAQAQLSWLSQPISARTLAWLVDSLVVIAALLLFAVIFLSIAHELPEWPLTLGAALAAAAFVAAAYWTLFEVFGGPSLGVRLAQATSGFEEKEESDGAARFR
jgi:PilZ domain